MCISPSVRIGQLGFQWTDFHEIRCLNSIQKSVEKIRGSLKSDKNNGTLCEAFHICTFVILSTWILLRMRNFSDKSCSESQNATLKFNTLSRKASGLWRNVEKYGIARQPTDDNIIRRMRFECWIPKAADTHTHNYSFSTATMVTRTRLNITLYVHCLSCCHSVTQTGSPFWLRTKLSKLLLNKTKSSETNMSASVWVSSGWINYIVLALMSGCERN